ncbi:MAG: FtsX-like permease family protein, partial [Actinomycetes bacterium]
MVRPMWNLTIRGIVAHRARLALSVVAVALAVAFVTGAYALTDTLDRSYSGVFAATQARVDLVVALRDQRGPEGTRQRLPEEVRSTVAAVPGVAEAHGVVRGSAQFVDRDGQPIRVNGAPTLAVSWSQRGSAGPLGLVGRASRAPRGPGEVAVDVATARDHGFTVGRRVRVIGLTGAREYRISGLFSIGGRTDLGGVTFASFDLATTQGVVGAPGRLDEVAVHATQGESVRLVRRRIATAIGPGFEVRSGSAVAADAGTQVRTALALLTAALLGFAAVGVVVAVLLVFNTFTIVMAQRTREVGLIRLVGASSGQVVAALVGEALVVGAVAAALGIVLGLVAVP